MPTDDSTGPGAESALTNAAVAAAERRVENNVPQAALDRVVAERWEERSKREEAQRQLAAAQATIEELRRAGERASTSTSTANSSDQSSVRLSSDELRLRIAHEAAIQKFNADANAVAEAGRKAHADFDAVVLTRLASFSPVYDPNTQRPTLPVPLIEAVLEAGDAHEVLYALGNDPASAERIMKLSPIRQAVEIAKFHAKVVGSGGAGSSTEDMEDESVTMSSEPEAETEAEPVVSRAPVPARVRASGSGSARPVKSVNDTKNTSMAEWMALRQREADTRRSRRH